MENRLGRSMLENATMWAAVGGTLVVAFVGAAFISSLNLIDRALAYVNGKSYEESKKDTRDYIIDDFFKEYDTNKEGVVDKQEYGVYVQQRYIDRK